MGPMSSGKSRDLISVYLNELQSKEEGRPYKDVILVKNATDTRAPTIHTRDSRTKNLQPDLQYLSADEVREFTKKFNPSQHILLIDEYQFPTEGDIAGLLDSLATSGFEIYVSTLQTSFNGMAFSEHVKDIFSYADRVVSFKATCSNCENDYGVRTMRTNNEGTPDQFDADVVNVGFDNYNPVCRKDHLVPGRPLHQFHQNLKENGRGSLKVISGPASSAKSDILKSYLVKFSGREPVSYYTSPPDISTLSRSSSVVLIDNYHKLNSDTQEYAMFLDHMATKGYFVVVAGDPLTAKNLPTPSLRELLPLADDISIESAYEKISGERMAATKTIQVNGSLKPVSRYTYLGLINPFQGGGPQ